MVDPSEVKKTKSFMHEGQQVWIERKIDNLKALACDGANLSLTDNYFEVRISDLEPVNGKRSYIKTALPKPTAERKAFKDDLNEFFDKVALRMPYRCMNCQKPLFASKKFFKRCVSAHILPKSDFASVATNEDNIVFLGAGIIGSCLCHDQYDSMGAEHRSKMPIFKTVLERFEKLKPLLTDKELVKAYTYLNLKWQ